jgi:hypothetical protein
MNFEEIYEMLENYYHGKYDVNDGILLKFSDDTCLTADWPDINTLILHVYPGKITEPHLNDAIVDFDTISPDGICNYMDFPEDMSPEEKVNAQIKFIAESIVDYMQENKLTCEPAIDIYSFDETDELEESVDDGIADLPRTTNFDKLYEETIGEFYPYKNTYKYYVTTPVYHNDGEKIRLIKFASDDLGECQANKEHDDLIVEFEGLNRVSDTHDPDSWLEYTTLKIGDKPAKVCSYCGAGLQADKTDTVCDTCAVKLMAEYDRKSSSRPKYTGD